MTVIIDHNKHPEIMTMILSYAPLASLAVLRRTSATFRKRVRRLLFHHVSLVTNHGEDAFITPPSPASLSLPPGSTLPFRPQHVRVLDLAENPLVPSRDTIRAMSSLRILRRTGKALKSVCSIKPRPYGPLVDFLDLDDMTSIIVDRVTPTIQPYQYFHSYVLHVQCAIEVVYNVVKALDAKFTGKLVIVGIENTRLEVLVKHHKVYRIDSAFIPFREKVEARLRAADRDSEALDGVKFRTVANWHAGLGEDKDYVGHWVDADERTKGSNPPRKQRKGHITLVHIRRPRQLPSTHSYLSIA
ncbi:uncharacterized protein LOC62_04G005291 [Vanrija pseudolonga]|uniref:F-box domain-containing protein n=1 Tax=Vanrija pseudolonga TaxID=143232 RepID=A0AAF0Y7Z9_9TREE|nr:hypothetical protein LOC62_04G005291 [Vanrija pseudolonga]